MFEFLRGIKNGKSNSTVKQSKTENKSEQEHVSEKSEKISVKERPRICLIDLEDDCVQSLKAKGFYCYEGTFGSLVEVPNKNTYDEHYCSIGIDYPRNMHEYDILIIDMQNPRTVPYLPEDHARGKVKGKSCLSLLSSYPETIFDPRPLAANILKDRIKPLMNKESIIIVFASIQERVEYHPVSITQDRTISHDIESYWRYDFSNRLPQNENVTGIDTTVVYNEEDELRKLLKQHNGNASYRIVFGHPTLRKNGGIVKDHNFIPLIKSRSGQIISFEYLDNENLTLYFPKIEQKAEFLTDLIEKVLPDIKPSLFPFSTQFAWQRDEIYTLPNEATLLQKKNLLREDYKTRLEKMEEDIEDNHLKYAFLHDLLMQTGDALVKTVEKYFKWLEFENVVNADETNPDIKEEDLRVETDEGLLVVEVKGIGGTSTDSECSQINKIKFRRAEERKKFDVFGLYLVNHQRHLPPEERENPPFNQTQIKDAGNDKRGLLTTYALFKLYFNVVDGFISKEDARKALFGIGLVRFKPSDASMIPKPYEIHHKGTVVIFNIEGVTIKKGAPVVLCDADRYRSAEIEEIRLDETVVAKADSGEVGVKLSEKVSKDTELWVVDNS